MKFIKIAAIVAAALSTQGCAAVVAGYLIGDAISTNERVKQCRENLRITNEQRLRDGKDLFPDQCK